MKNTSFSIACRDESDDMSLKEKKRGFRDQKDVFFYKIAVFIGNDEIRKRAK